MSNRLAALSARLTEHPIEPLFLQRWSPRAFDGSAMPQSDLDTILDAAHWAPSAFNYQPWRFLYAHRGDKHWDAFQGLLVPFNQSWAKDACVLLFILSDTQLDAGQGPRPSHSHSFDAGAAWAQLALQTTALGYQAHGMTGVDFGKAQKVLNVPETFRVEAAVAIGRQADASTLPEALRAREAPSDRKPLAAVSFAGPLPD
jgi:nitroreductase